MVTPALAQQLKQAGLLWRPTLRDTFALLDRDMDDQIFAISDTTVLVQLLHGDPVVTFHGSVEWALDAVQLAETVWLPSETQVRDELESLLATTPYPGLRLERTPTRYHCAITLESGGLLFAAETASDAYGLALLHLLAAHP